MVALESLSVDNALPDGLALIDAELSDAESRGIIASVAASGEAFFSSPAGRSLIPALRDRLFRLGYLRVRDGDNQVDEPLRAAVRKLQSEAGLTVDGWVGRETWNALQELFAFEPSTLLERWIDHSGMTPALQRAAALRLISLGLMPDRTRADVALLPRALAEWRRVLLLLEALPIRELSSTEDLPLYRWLFDIEKLTQLVIERAPTLAQALDSNDADSKLLLRFLKALLKIELWLLGYNQLRPDGKPLGITRNLRTRAALGLRRTSGSYRYSVFYSAIRAFWRDLDAPLDHGNEAEIVLRTFALLIDQSEQTTRQAANRSARARRIMRELDDSREQRRVGKAWQGQALVGLLWDGLKRAWRFLTRLFRGVAHRINLLARTAYQIACEGYSIMRRAAQVFTEGFGLLFRAEIAGSNDAIAMRHRADFDFEVYLDARASSSDVTQFAAGLHNSVVALGAALTILKIIFAAAMTAITLVATPWAWWRLIRTLIDLDRIVDEDDVERIGAAFLYA